MPRSAKHHSTRWIEIVRRALSGAMSDNISSHAAELSYYFLLAIFPLLICMVTLLNIVFHASPHIEISLLTVVTRALPFSAAELVMNTLNQVSQEHPETKVSFGLILSFWWASAGMLAVIDALNSVYQVKEGRGFLRRSLVAAALTVAVALLLLAAVGALFAAGPVVGTISYGIKAVAIKLILWPLALLLGLLSFAVIYYFAPDVKQQEWHWITPGAVVGLILWSLVSLSLKIYLHFYDTYDLTYGSLGAVIVLLLWFYLSGAAVLMGAEVNTAMEAVAARRGDPRAKVKGKLVGETAPAGAAAEEASAAAGNTPPIRDRVA